MGDVSTLQIGWTDQANINRFATLNQSVVRLEARHKIDAKNLEELIDSCQELEMRELDCDDEEDEDIDDEELGEVEDGKNRKVVDAERGGVRIKVGDVFLTMKIDKAIAYLETRKSELEAKTTSSKSKIESIESEMNRLKNILYAKFKDSIQLERGSKEDSD